MNASQGGIFWHQGMFLQPQHFQLAERCTQSLFFPYQSYLAPHFWGVCRAAVRTRSVGLFSLELSSGAFLFPDGTHVQLPGNAAVESRIVPDGMVVKGAPVTAYLGLKKWQDQGGNVSASANADAPGAITTRYVAEAEATPCPDLHAGGPTADVRRLNHVLKIFWESELDLLGDYLLIPLTRLEIRGDGIEISREFIPPCVTIAASPQLADLVSEIRDHVAARCRRLESGKKQRGVQGAEFGSKDLVYLFALRTLNRHLAQLDHIIHAGDVHPWHAYGLLAQLVAELSCFSETVTVYGGSKAEETPLLSEYRHLDLGGCFSQAHDLVVKLLDQVTAGPEYALSLSYDGSYFCSDLKPAHFQGRNRFYLAVRTDAEPDAVLGNLTTLAKLSPRERLPLLIAQALPGIPLEHLPNPPQELPRRASSLYFAVDSRCEQWELVQKWNNIALFWDQAPDDLEAELLIVNRG